MIPPWWQKSISIWALAYSCSKVTEDVSCSPVRQIGPNVMFPTEGRPCPGLNCESPICCPWKNACRDSLPGSSAQLLNMLLKRLYDGWCTNSKVWLTNQRRDLIPTWLVYIAANYNVLCYLVMTVSDEWEQGIAGTTDHSQFSKLIYILDSQGVLMPCQVWSFIRAPQLKREASVTMVTSAVGVWKPHSNFLWLCPPDKSAEPWVELSLWHWCSPSLGCTER